jgi:oligo-1,6-glucosidase
MLATMLFTLRGTVGVYQGDELGMTNRNFSSISQFRDIQALNAYQEIVVEKGNDEQDFIHSLNDFSRDHARTPMHWSDKINAGFTNRTPWIGLNENYPMINAEQQKADKNSVLNYYKQLIKLRKSSPLYVYGETEILHKADDNIYAYVRQYEGEASLVVLNFSGDKQVYTLPEKWAKKMQDSALAISNYSSTQGSAILNLKPYEARVYKL